MLTILTFGWKEWVVSKISIHWILEGWESQALENKQKYNTRNKLIDFFLNHGLIPS